MGYNVLMTLASEHALKIAPCTQPGRCLAQQVIVLDGPFQFAAAAAATQVFTTLSASVGVCRGPAMYWQILHPGVQNHAYS